MVHSEVNSQRLLRYGSNPQLDDIRMTAETTQNFSFLQHTPGQRDGHADMCIHVDTIPAFTPGADP